MAAKTKGKVAPAIDHTLTTAPQLGQLKTSDTSFLQTDCREVWWKSSRLPSTKQVSADNKRDMVIPTEGEVGGYSISKRIFASRHPAISAVNEVFRRFDDLRDEYTIVKSVAASSESERFQVEPSHRIIRVTDITEFEQKFVELQADLKAAVANVAYCLDNEKLYDNKMVPSIKQTDRGRLGRSFNETDYPTADMLMADIKVSAPQYAAMQPDKLLPPKILAREMERINQELGDTVALAASRVGNDLVAAMETLARNLSRKIQLDPLPGDEWRDDLIKRHPVEVVNVLETRHDRSIPDGSIKLELAWKEPDGDSTKTVKITTNVITKEFYETKLRPQETSNRRTLRSSSIENLNKSLECLSRVQSMLGASGAQIETSLETVKQLLRSCSRDGDAGQVVAELRQSDAAADMLQKALMEAVETVQESSESAIRVRRRIHF